ncbi:MAG: FIST C-terminal domain-containing protein [Elusimicrobia bacterium]|nr:FIST C-terminal domain-containing protein [Elusimicrobiota bacterium]
MTKVATKKAFAAAISTDPDWRKALEAVALKAKAQLDGPCDLAAIFVTELYPGLVAAEIPGLIRKYLPCPVLLGCNTSGVISEGREVEAEPAVSLLAMRLPGVKVSPFALTSAELESFNSPAQLIESLDIFPTDKPKFLVLADPMSCDIEEFVSDFNEAYPKAPVIGGLASGPALRKPSWLLVGGEAYTKGAVGVALSGDVDFEIIVAQGCRPVGKPYTITKADGHVLQELGGRPPLELLRETLSMLPAEDQALARHSLFAGVVMNEVRAKFKRGDFVIRNIMGYEAQSGAIMIGANLRKGQTLQFQLRDAETSDEDLRAHLADLKDAKGEPRGALLVSCCGRGRGLYGAPDHDSGLVQSMKGPLPLAGFFANGELGPVGGKNYIYGYTTSLAVIR